MLVVAPYNAQVLLLREHLDAAGFDGVAVGTVDKFQGRQAPVVFVSMTASSHRDVPRGIAFLLNRNRLNVAVSRAKYTSIIVRSEDTHRIPAVDPGPPDRIGGVPVAGARRPSRGVISPQRYSTSRPAWSAAPDWTRRRTRRGNACRWNGMGDAGFVVGQPVAGRTVIAGLVRALVMGVAAEVQRVVGAEDIRLARLRVRRRLPARLEAAQRLEPLLVVDVETVVGESDRLHRRFRRGHVGEEVEQAAAPAPVE